MRPTHPTPAVTERVDAALGKLDLGQKVRLLTGSGFWGTHSEPLLGLRAMVLSDGPAGVRGVTWDERETSVNVPSPTALAATWDDPLVERIGALLAGEARRKGVDVLLAPTVNLHRTPLGGRHFECYSEDPLLTARIGTAYVTGVQSGGVGATVKHYVANDSETERMTVDVRVDERTLRELYLAPFEAIVRDADPWLVMAAYNGVNGATMTENGLLADPLKSEWGFDGVVVSDWLATHSTEESGRAALDLVMPGPTGPWGEQLVAAVRAGAVSEADVDEKLRRLLVLAARVGALEGIPPVVPPASAPGEERTGLLRETAARAMVLVRNESGVLPLDRSGLRRVAVLGPNAQVARTQGGGSAWVSPERLVSPLDGLRAALGSDVEVSYATGARTSRTLQPVPIASTRDPVSGEPGLRVRLVDAAGTVLTDELRLSGTLRWIGDEQVARAAAVEIETVFRADEAGPHRLGVRGVGRFLLEADGHALVDEEITVGAAEAFAAFLDPPGRSAVVELAAGQEVRLRLRHERAGEIPVLSLVLGAEPPMPSDEEALAVAADLAGAADVAIVVVGTTDEIESEGFDRTTLGLPGRQDDLVRRVAAANPRTIVVVNSGAPVLMPWRDRVAAVLLSWFPGQEFGDALADVVLGLAEPGGRLPTTWPAAETDVPVLSAVPTDGRLDYAERLRIGYRAWADSGRVPAYPFGHGLGYTTWDYLGVDVQPASDQSVVAAVRLRNAGVRRGREVVQAYLSWPDSPVVRPPLWLAGYAAVEVDAGADALAEVRIDRRAFAHWMVGSGWTVEPGSYQLRIGRSAADLPLSTTIRL
jgi:beta-glucosidase